MSGSRAKLIRKAARIIAQKHEMKYDDYKRMYRNMKKEWVRR